MSKYLEGGQFKVSYGKEGEDVKSNALLLQKVKNTPTDIKAWLEYIKA